MVSLGARSTKIDQVLLRLGSIARDIDHTTDASIVAYCLDQSRSYRNKQVLLVGFNHEQNYTYAGRSEVDR